MLTIVTLLARRALAAYAITVRDRTRSVEQPVLGTADVAKRMKHEQARRLLDRIGVLRDPCDLDLLLFFVRHPHALISSDQLAAFLGYPVKRLGDSLEVLLTAKLLSRTLKPSGVARLYAFADGHAPEFGWLSSLVELASTRDGRLALRNALADRRKGEPSVPVEVAGSNQTPEKN